MSLVAMKRKHAEKQNISKGTFSLNGGIRNLPYIGRSSAQYRSEASSNDSSVVKISAKNTSGYMASRFEKQPVAKDVEGNISSSKHTQELREAEEMCQKKADDGC
jgi:hypothetical protein